MRKHLIALAAVLVALVCLAGCTTPGQSQGSANSANSASSTSASSQAASQAASGSSSVGGDAPTPFPSWAANADSLATLVAYVEAATDEAGTGYVPPKDRIAVFDMDGTFICERAPIYLDYMMFLHRALEDPGYAAPDDIRAFCEEVRALADKGVVIDNTGRALTKDMAMAQVFAGMTPDELHAYVVNFTSTTEVEGFSGMTYGESFYQPMLEVIAYLQKNNFDVYVVTACEREVVRPLAEKLGIDAGHVIGSDWSYTATKQGDATGLDYTFARDDEILLGGTYLGETGKANKVFAIQREIGKRPVLAFGNSSGDFAMLNYTVANDTYPSASFLVVADDTEREYGDAEKAAKMRAEATAGGWTAISMRDDWATIYGEGVEKTRLRADEAVELPLAA